MDLARKAIDAALVRDWKTAIAINLELIRENPLDIDSLNRLGRAYFETGQRNKAISAYQKVIQLDKFNPIALRGLSSTKSVSGTLKNFRPLTTPTTAPIFLEEPGVTKTISLTRLGDPATISRLHPGDPVSLVAREHCVSVMSNSSLYLGRLPDDLASRMRSFLKAGNTYGAWVKSLDTTQGAAKLSLKIFMREVTRSQKFRNVPSFPITEKLTYAAFTPPELIHEEKPDSGFSDDEKSEMVSGSVRTSREPDFT